MKGRLAKVKNSDVESSHEVVDEDFVAESEQLDEPSLAELKEMDWFIQRKIGTFDGESMERWADFVVLFENTCRKRKWDVYPEEVLVELLAARLVGNARKAWEAWILEEPEMMMDFLKFKLEFGGRSDGKVNPWKSLVDFHGLQMKYNEDIDVYVSRYESIRRMVDDDGCAAVKFFFSLPTRVRELLGRHAGEWPRCLKGMIDLTKDVILRDETVNFNKEKALGESTSRNTIVCFGCGEKGHIASKCPRRIQDKLLLKEKEINIKSNLVKDKNSNYSSSSVYVLMMLYFSNKELSFSALVDSGASSNFISESIVRREGMFKSRLKKPVRLEMAAKSFVVYARYETDMITIKINDHVEEIKFIVVPELQEEIILGKTWLDIHNPLIDWPTGELTFSRCSCVIERIAGTVAVERKEISREETVSIKVTEISCDQEEINSCQINEVVDLSESEPENSHEDMDNDLEWESDEEIGCCSDNDSDYSHEDDNTDVKIIYGFEKDQFLKRVQTFQVDESSEFVDEILEVENIKSKEDVPLPNDYQDFVEVFSKELAEELPPLNNKYQCAIEFKVNAILPKPRKPFTLSMPERNALAIFIEENLQKGFIRKSKSPIALGTFLVPKPNGEYRTVVDFRPVNDIVVDNRNPIPSIDDLMMYLNDARIFTKIDLRGAYNLLRIRPGDEWKTAFVCSQGQFEYTVMPFGLKTAPSIFQSMMEDIFSDMLRQSVLIYLDDILIFSKSTEDHVSLVREVLRRLQENRLLAKKEKCVFSTNCIDFLGYVISDKGISVAPDKVKTILDWPVPVKRRELKSFLGTANFNRKFIAGYSNIVAPLLALDSKEIKKFQTAWTAQCDEAFSKLKEMMASAPVLRHVNFNLPFIVETDASDFAVGAVLLQPENLESV